MSEVDELALAFSEVRATVIVGTGLSISCSKGAGTASWIGFLWESVEWASDNIPSITEGWIAAVKHSLRAAEDESDTSLLLSAASLISNKIGSQGEQAKLNWLGALIGSLEPKDPSWATAIDGLGCPILTTNYDTLIEKSTGRLSADWTDPIELQRVISRQSPAVGHLHGVWNQVPSVVLSEGDYERALSSAPLQALQQAASSVRSLVYIGVGEGLGDPNFSRLLDWHRNTFALSGVPHFRLCRESELSHLRKVHAADNITPVSYGSEYQDLPKFLAQFHSQHRAGVVVQNRTEIARDALTERVRKLTVICENMQDIDERSIDQLIAPPVLQPMSSEQERAAQTIEFAEKRRVERSDAYEVASQTGVTIIAGRDGSGRTTALYWLLEEASKSSGAMPLMVASKDLHKGGKPLINALREKSREAGFPMGRGEVLSNLVVGIDDLSPYNTTICQQTLKDIKGLENTPIFITCQEGYEAELVAQFLDYQIDPYVQYVGELWRSDIRNLLELVSPIRPKTIEDNVVSIVQQHHLPRTPFTISLLISVLLGGKLVPANSSHTTLLDLYLNQLIGRGDFAEDSRWGMDADLRAAVLADLAKLFVEKQDGFISEGDVTTRMASFFSARGIPESAVTLLQELRSRKVLQYEKGMISFSHSSYLYVFAAKAATKDPQLKDLMLANPLLYAPILKHYASLERADKGFLLAVERFFLELDGTVQSADSLHAPVSQVDAPDDLEERILGLPSDHGSTTPESDGEHHARSDNEDKPVDDLEMYPRSDTQVALLELPANLPSFHRYSIGLDLISTALRDSVLIADPELKSRVMSLVLVGWGKLGSIFVEDPELVSAVARVLSRVAHTLDVPEDRREVLVRLLSEITPALIVSAGISSSLSTTRLVAALSDALDNHALADNPDGAIAAAIFLLDVQSEGWIRDLERVTEKHRNLKVMTDSIKLLSLAAYLSKNGRVDESHRLLRLISDLESRRLRFKKDAARQSFRGVLEQRISGMKSLSTLKERQD